LLQETKKKGAIGSLLFILILLISCSTLEPFEIFYVTKGQLQYFLRPAKLTGTDSEVLMDITYREEGPEENQEGFVTCNFSLLGTESRDIDRAYFSSGDQTWELTDLTILFIQRKNKEIRISAEWIPTQWLQWLQNEDFTFTVVSGDKSYQHTPTASFTKAQRELAFELAP